MVAMQTTEVRASEKPILFSAPMVRAILEGRKTQTRRVLQDSVLTRPPYRFDHISSDLGYPASLGCVWAGFYHDGQDAGASALYVKCPYGKPGDRLRVKESFYAYGRYRYTGKLTESGKREVEFVDATLEMGCKYQYAADVTFGKPSNRHTLGWHKRPSIFMPAAASRLSLEILSVRVERLREINANDIAAEGVGETWWPTSNLRARWVRGWDHINGKRAGCAWKDNPWVWVIEFKRPT